MSNQVPATPFAGGARSTTSSRKGARVFTVCGQKGPSGPSQSQANSAYSGTTLAGEVTIDKGVQILRPLLEDIPLRLWGCGGNKDPESVVLVPERSVIFSSSR